MSCFSLDFWFKVCVLIILVIGLWQIVRLFLPYLENKLPPLVVQIINIVIWVGIAILCVVIIFFFLSCIWGAVSGMFGGGLHSFRSGFVLGPAANLLFGRTERQRLLPAS
jgi:uncharacterized protein involved in cysteine biosynthesis